jgi:hypothetical protein
MQRKFSRTERRKICSQTQQQWPRRSNSSGSIRTTAQEAAAAAVSATVSSADVDSAVTMRVADTPVSTATSVAATVTAATATATARAAVAAATAAPSTTKQRIAQTKISSWKGLYGGVYKPTPPAKRRQPSMCTSRMTSQMAGASLMGCRQQELDLQRVPRETELPI